MLLENSCMLWLLTITTGPWLVFANFSLPSTVQSLWPTLNIDIFWQNSNFSQVHTCFLYILIYPAAMDREFEILTLANSGTSGDYQSDGHCAVASFCQDQPKSILFPFWNYCLFPYSSDCFCQDRPKHFFFSIAMLWYLDPAVTGL